jgi:hypothetical protein
MKTTVVLESAEFHAVRAAQPVGEPIWVTVLGCLLTAALFALALWSL